MPTLTEKRNAAGDRYRSAVLEMRAAYLDLAALDRLCGAQGFGLPIDTCSLRHSTYLADLHGSFVDGVAVAVEKHSIG